MTWFVLVNLPSTPGHQQAATPLGNLTIRAHDFCQSVSRDEHLAELFVLCVSTDDTSDDLRETLDLNQRQDSLERFETLVNSLGILARLRLGLAVLLNVDTNTEQLGVLLHHLYISRHSLVLLHKLTPGRILSLGALHKASRIESRVISSYH